MLSAFAGVYLLVATGFIWAAWAVVATASVRLGWPAVVATTALGVLLVSYLCLMGAVPLSDPAYYSTPWVVPAHLRGRLSLGDRPAGRAMGDRARVSFRYAL